MSERKLDTTTLHALVDGELTPSERSTALEAADSDPATTMMYAEYRRLKEAVSSLPAIEVPPSTWRQCQRRLDEIDRNRKAERFVSRYAWALSASIFFLIVGAGSWNRLTGQRMAAGDVSHMASLLSPLSRSDTPQSGQVGKWLQDQVGPVSLKNLEVLHVISAQAGDVDGKRLVRLILQDSQSRMALYIWPGNDTIDGFVPIDGGPLSAGRLFDQNCVAWNQNDCHVVLVGPRETADLERVATVVSNGAVSIGNN